MVSRRLPGAPVSFQRFVRRELRRLHRVDHCDPGAIGIGVNRLRTDGFARGGVSDCGGYVAIWKQVDGRWRQIIGTQDIWTCRELRPFEVPSAGVGPHAQCARGRSEVAYHHR